MALTPDFNNLIIYSDSSILDIVTFHIELRDIEYSSIGMLYPVIHTYKEINLGGGAIFPAIAFINGWTLQFPAGNWTIKGGNLDVIINPVQNCYVTQTQSGAYAVTNATAEQDDSNSIKKGIAFNNFTFILNSKLDNITPIEGEVIVSQRSIDGGTFALCTNLATEIGSGLYKINLSASDLNGNIITLKFSSTNAATRFITIIPT